MTAAVPETGRRIRVGFAKVRDGHGFTLALPTAQVEEAAPARIPLRIARLLAFAHEVERRIAAGEVRNRAAVARELGVSRARITQILDLLLLAPDIQEEILFSEVEPGYHPINEHALRWVVQARDWPTQRARWRDLNAV
ncbi:MAG: hypothetical protein PHU25_15385 [Deltaproteobacteria bacterium]|nr:hypothetical protein [Deltaproteobacteria bacterium]